MAFFLISISSQTGQEQSKCEALAAEAQRMKDESDHELQEALPAMEKAWNDRGIGGFPREDRKNHSAEDFQNQKKLKHRIL